jgi:hypothetical protein
MRLMWPELGHHGGVGVTEYRRVLAGGLDENHTGLDEFDDLALVSD